MKKKILLIAIAVCLVSIMACGSLAYFTAKSSVTNSFMVASSDDQEPVEEPEEIFSIEVFEEDPNGEKTNEGNTYEDIEPGDKIAKKPQIQNTGAYDQWVRVTVTFDKASAWLAADSSFTAANLFDKLVANFSDSGFVATNWDRVNPTGANTSDELVYVFYYKNKLVKDQVVSLFEYVRIPTVLESDDMVALDGFQIVVKADAIQADNTGSSAKATFENPSFWVEE